MVEALLLPEAQKLGEWVEDREPVEQPLAVWIRTVWVGV